MQHLYFDDIAVNQEVPNLIKGPLTTMHIMRWSSAMENWHRIHYDLPFAVNHDKLPGVLINGTLKQQFIIQLLKDWIKPNGWIWKVNFQFRSMSIAGETLVTWGRVESKTITKEYGLINLNLGIKNEKNEETSPGTAVVAIPFRNGPTLPYPFKPPIYLTNDQVA